MMNKHTYKHRQKLLSAFAEWQDRRRLLNNWYAYMKKAESELAEYENSIDFDGENMENKHVSLSNNVLRNWIGVSERKEELKEAILTFRRIRDGLYSSHVKNEILKRKKRYDHNRKTYPPTKISAKR